MRRVIIDGVHGDALWDDDGPLIAFRPDGSETWSYTLHPNQPKQAWHPDYEEAE